MRASRGQDSIGGLCRLSALLEEGVEAALGSNRGRLCEIRAEADSVTKSLMQSVFSDFITPLDRGETGSAALALYECIVLLPEGGCNSVTERCVELCRSIRLCCSALRGRGKGDCGLDCYFSALAALGHGSASGTQWGRVAAAMLRAYAALCTALLGSI